MIGIIGAMEQEVRALMDKMTDRTEKKAGISSICEGTLFGKRVLLARCGIGKVHAAMCAQAMLLTAPVDLLLNIGVAGALTEKTGIAHCVIATSAVQHDMDTSPLGDPPGMISGIDLVHLPCDEKAVRGLEAACERAGIPHVLGAVATGDRFVEDKNEKLRLNRLFGAEACDMEGAAIAQAAYEMGVPYAAYRCISDTLNGNGREYAENAARAAEASQRLLEQFLTQG